MQTPIVLYIATVAGALGLVMLMPKPRGNFRVLGTLLAGGALGGAWLWLAGRMQWPGDLGGMPQTAFSYYYVFSAIAIVAGVRVITHTRPVYSALWFVLVVLASAGLLLVLGAEFMAFAMVIIYAGAILVTYVFVIMLASQSESPEAPAGGAGQTPEDDPELSPIYDRFAREPFSAVVAGFLLLAVLLTVSFPPEPMHPNEAAEAQHDHDMIQQVLAERPAVSVEARLEGMMPGQEQLAAAVGSPSERLSNAERIGVDLFRSHPLGLELAGVILLVALIGAVVIAKTRIPEEGEQPVR